MTLVKKKLTVTKKAAPNKKKKVHGNTGRKNTGGVTKKVKVNGKLDTGQKEFEPTKDQRTMVAVMTGCGMTQADLCTLIPSPTNRAEHIDLKTLRKHFEYELATGKARSVAKVAGRLYSEAVDKNGNIAAAIFYLRTQGKWSTAVGVQNPDGSALLNPLAEVLKNALQDSGDLEDDDSIEGQDGAGD